MKDKDKIIFLCDYYIKTHPYDSIRWGWGEGLIVFALMELDKHLKTNRYLDYVKNYCLYHYNKGIEINSSDTVCPCLASLELYKITKEKIYKDITDLGVKYIKESDKILDGIPNHFGFSKSSSYPKSIWVDSLMMFSVFSSRYAKEFNDKELMEYAKGMPKIFSKYLQNECGLWNHSYWTETKKAYPEGLYWGRGNGWVCLSFPMIDEICLNGDSFKDEYKRTIDSMIKYQLRSGCFRTIINKRISYKETSVTTLFSAGLYKAINNGLIDKNYKVYADRAYKYSMKKLIVSKKGTFLKGISRPTVPARKRPFLYYLIMVKKSNFNYGIAAMIFAYINKGE